MLRYSVLLGVLLLFSTCSQEATQDAATAELIVHNANIFSGYQLPRAGAMAVANGRILATGDDLTALESFRSDSTQVLDLDGQFVMPGFIEAHGHFSGLGASLRNLNFLKSRSWEEIVAMVQARAQETPAGEWITGRGWHQEKWEHPPHDHTLGSGYPLHDGLSELTANNPVMLRHASGHSLFANARAMEIAGVTAETPDPRGGRIVRDASGQPTGVFEERAMQLITSAYQAYLDSLSQDDLKEEWLAGIAAAEEECLSKGITSFQDAGSSFEEIEWYTDLAEAGELDLRLWAMVRHPYQRLLRGNLDALPIIDAGDHFFTCRAIKSEVDGALGAYGAWLLEPYADKPDFVGQNTTMVETVDSIADLALEHGLQLCVHAIGDRANREVLDLMERRLPAGEDMRWRIEHSQHLHPDDIPRFAELGVIAAMQGIHCTSDAPFVVKRLGEQRAREGAYPWRSLWDTGAVIANGTDAPVEDVSALESFYATVTRKRADTGMEFFPEQALTREEALATYTSKAAYAAFEEADKGTLEPGKLADFVVLSNDLVTCPDSLILRTEVLQTFVGGQSKYRKD
jgi:predicted amidohydrolase YtcJ